MNFLGKIKYFNVLFQEIGFDWFYVLYTHSSSVKIDDRSIGYCKSTVFNS